MFISILENTANIHTLMNNRLEKETDIVYVPYCQCMSCIRVPNTSFDLSIGNLLSNEIYCIARGLCGYKTNGWIRHSHVIALGGTIKDGQKGIHHNKLLNEKQTIKRIRKNLVWFNVDQVNGVVFDVEDTDTIIQRLMNSQAFSELLTLFPSDEIREVCLQWLIKMKFRSFEDFCLHLIKTTTGYIPDVYQMSDIESGAVAEMTAWLVCHEFGLAKPWNIVTSHVWRFLENQPVQDRKMALSKVCTLASELAEKIIDGEFHRLYDHLLF